MLLAFWVAIGVVLCFVDKEVGLLTLGSAAYMLPGLTAMARNHRNEAAIFALNFLLGWTLLGWVVALVWSFTEPRPSR
jgi:hypothetical protein